jgi:hypothetical protein
VLRGALNGLKWVAVLSDVGLGVFPAIQAIGGAF